jgi:hypothetical protein
VLDVVNDHVPLFATLHNASEIPVVSRFMPFSVLKTSHEAEKKTVEVMGEFESEDEARVFAEDANKCDPDNEYSVESPPSPPEKRPWALS